MQTHMPIGYKMVNGKVVIDKKKSKTVLKIFNEYVDGKTILGLAKELTANKVPKSSNKTNWTHGAVGRILENVKYLGDDIYPKLIDQELFDKAAAKRTQQVKKLGREFCHNSSQSENIFSNKVFCGTCGAVYRTYVEHSDKLYKKRYWKCKNYIYKNKVQCQNLFYTKDELMEIAIKVINMAINTPKILERKPMQYAQKKSSELVEVEKQIENLEENEDFAATELKELIFKRAVLTYNESKIDDYDVNTQMIKEILEDVAPLTELNEEIFSQIVKRITIYKDGNVEVRFINGVAIIEQCK